MKKSLVGIICIMYIFFGNSQDKFAYYNTTIAGATYEMGEFCDDTIINNREYEIIKGSSFRFGDLKPIKTYRLGYRRISGDSVFVLRRKGPGFDLEESLLYAFNLKVGDCIYLDYLINFLNDTFKVYKTDTIELFGNNKRRIFLRSTYPNSNNEDIWIDGIGSIRHGYKDPGFPIDISDAGSAFSCYYDSESKQTYAPYDSLPCHMDKLEKACSIPNSTEDDLRKITSIVSPNPFRDVIDFYTNDTPVKLTLYNINGNLLREVTILNKHYTMDGQELSAGLYLIKLTDGSQTEIIKLIKN
jgi:hypothetical protein